MTWLCVWALLVCLAGCRDMSAARLPAPQASDATPVILILTPTPVPTLVPTVVREPTAQPTVPVPTEEPTASLSPHSCGELLETHYAAASQHCLVSETGGFCNGGLPPQVSPASDALDAPAAQLAADAVERLRSPPLSAADGGGLLWLRLEGDILIDALIIGGLEMNNRVTSTSEMADWRSFTIESQPAAGECPGLPPLGALVVQGLYGQRADVFINGVASEINGTLIALTQGEHTKFLSIEGRSVLVAFGQTVTLEVGEQLELLYQPGDWTRPAQLPASPTLLDAELIRHMPVALFGRPVPIPQPGYGQTQGLVNMRAAPSLSGRLLYQVPAGETMGILGRSSDGKWLHIRLGNGETGWMSAELLAGKQDAAQIQAIYDITPEPPQRYGDYAHLATVAVPRGSNLREAPDTSFRVLRTLPYGTEVSLRARSPYSPWVQVKAGDELGWMALFTLQTEAVISSLPINYDVPLPTRATATPSFSFGGGHAYPNPDGGY